MPDLVDLVNDQQQHILDLRIKNARQSQNTLRPKGRCYFCDEDVEQPRLFCDADCASDYDKLKRK